MAVVAQAEYGGGSGTPEEPYQIWDANDMQAIGAEPNDWDKHFVLMADIDLQSYVAEEFNVIGNEDRPFQGVFDGNDHTIRNFTYKSVGQDELGLFGVVYYGGVVRDLHLIDPNIDSGRGRRVGCVVGWLQSGLVEECRVDGARLEGAGYIGLLVGSSDAGGRITCSDVNGYVVGENFAGGLAGGNSGVISGCSSSGDVLMSNERGGGGLVAINWGGGQIRNSHSSSDVSGWSWIGGLVGVNQDGIISQCYATGTASGDIGVGGFVGYNRSAIALCRSTGAVDGDGTIGGFVGGNQGSITDSHTKGIVLGTKNVGGFVGRNDGTFVSCSATGHVEGTAGVGGFAGRDYEGAIDHCYATGSVSGSEDFIGGLIGYSDGSSVSRSYACVAVDGIGTIGGLIGRSSATITSCFYAGVLVDGDGHVGGLIGSNYGTISGSYWDSQASGEPNMCGWQHDARPYGSATGCDPNYGKTTSQMRLQHTFTNWDFINVWDIGENQTYPYLRTHRASDINKDNITNFLDLSIVAEQWMGDE